MRRERTNQSIAIGILLLMVLTPLSAADIANYSGPPAISSTGNTRVVDAWEVPGNATILDAWLNVDADVMPVIGNGSGWDGVTANSNFTSGTYTDTTSTHFDELLSLDTNGSFGNVDHFNSPPSYQLTPTFTTGGSAAVSWIPTELNYSGTPASLNGNTVTNGTIPAAPTEGNIAIGTNPNGGIPAGSNSWVAGPAITLPSPISNFTFEFDLWYHLNTPNNTNGDMDGAWLEYRLDNGNWSWIAPTSAGYTNTISPNATLPSGANQSANGSHGFPVWAKVSHSGWQHPIFELDNLTGISNATTIQFRLQLWTDPASTIRPGVFIDNLTIINQGSAVGYFHHGCYAFTGTCTYAANTYGALQVNPLNLSATSGNPILRTRLEWDLEGGVWDNLCIEMSLNNNTWGDLSSGSNATTTTCAGRTGPIPGNGYTVGTTTYGDETSGFIDLDLTIPATYVGQSPVYLRYVVEVDGIINNGGTLDNLEGVTLDRIQILSSAGNNSTSYYDNPLANSGSAFHYLATHGTHTVDDWSYLLIGQGGLLDTYGFEDSPSFPPGGWGVTNVGSASEEWDYGQLSPTATSGPGSWSSGVYGFATLPDSSYVNNMDTELLTPVYNIPAGASARLTFDHWMCAESNYDGGAVFISVNNGTFTQFDPSVTGPGQTSTWYDGTIGTFASHSLAGLAVFNGRGSGTCGQATTTWQTKTGNLTQYQGSSVQFKFIFATDGSVTYDGWYLDEIGVEVDYFESLGDWLSPAIMIPELGLGFLDVDATVPTNTSVIASITDTAGNPLDGYSNVTIPTSLAGIDRDIYPAIKIRIQLGTSNPFVTPLVDQIHVGSTRYFSGLNGNPSWGGLAAFTEVNGTATNNNPTPQAINSGPVISSAPIQQVNVTGVGQGVTVVLLDTLGNIVANGSLNSTLSFSSPEPGFEVRYIVSPNGNLEWATANGLMVQPALNPEIDVTDDGTVDWAFPYSPNFGHLGWQSLIHSTDGTSNAAGTTTASLSTSNGTDTFVVLVPDGAVVTSGGITLTASTPISAITFSLDGTTANHGHSPAVDGVYYKEFDYWLSLIQNSTADYTDAATGRLWKTVEFGISSTQNMNVDIKSVTIGYELTENVTGLGPQLYNYHAAQLTGSIPVSVDIPLAFLADKGAVGLDGGILHERMIENLPFTVPAGTMYPAGEVYSIVTKHDHLTNDDLIDEISLYGDATGGDTIRWRVNNLTSGGTFTSNGTAPIDLLPSSSVSHDGTYWVVTWDFEIPWLIDDVDDIDWTARAVNDSGVGLSPAFAVSGGPGKNAIENDLQIDSFEVRDQFDRIITIDPNRDFYAEGGSDLSISGTVRFQDSTAARPLTDGYSVGVDFSGTDYLMSSHDNGSFSGTIALPADSSLTTLLPRIVRVGPASGSFGTDDVTGPMDTVAVFSDVTPPVADIFQVLTSNGLLDANGHVWDPNTPLQVSLVINDAEALGDNLTLHYWREGVDDDGDGIAEEGEYQSITRPISQPGISKEQQISFSGIDVSAVPANGRTSLYLTGTDWASHPFDGAGTAGVDLDKATMVIGIDAPTSILENEFNLDTANDHLLVGQSHTLTIGIQDDNGVHTLDDIIIYLAGQQSAPTGEIHIDPREGTATVPFGSFVIVNDVTMNSLGDTASTIDITFELEWAFPEAFAGNWLMPAIHIVDDTQTIANVNNIGELRWKLDNDLTVEIDMLHDLSEPLSESSNNKLYLGKGDIFALTGTVVYAGSGAPLPTVPDGVQLYASMSASGIISDVTVDLVEAYFNTTMLIPVGYPSTNSLPVIIELLNVPGQGSSITNTNVTIAIDSTPPMAEFPTGVLTTIESDRIEAVDVRVNVLESGGMAESPLVINWVYLRGGLNLPDSGGSSTVDYESVIGELWLYSAMINMTPANGYELREGDQVAIWLEASDLAGNELFGDGTADSPRSPRIIIRVFLPELAKVEIDNLNPELQDNIFIQVTIRNNGSTMGSVNVTLVEELDDGTLQIYDSHSIENLAPSNKRVVGFAWEAWDSGKPDLYIMWDEDPNRLTMINPQIDVKNAETDGGIFSSGSGGMIIGLLAILALGVAVAVGAMLMRQKADWDDEEEWEEVEAIATQMLDSPAAAPPVAEGATPEPSQSAAISPHGVEVPADAPLPEQAPPPSSEEEWLAKAKEHLPDWPDESLLGYKANGWTVEALVEWKESNQE